jgi:archaellum biogenesis protein FlaJ (TadC family)
MGRQGKEPKMKLSLRIALTLTVIVVMGVIAFIKAMTKAGPFPTPYFIIWIIVSVILIGMTVWSWLRSKKK